MDGRRSRCVEAVGLLHLLPGAMMLLGVSFLLWLTGLSALLTWSAEKNPGTELVQAVILLFGFSLAIPALLALPLFSLGVGLLRRRAWARFVALYLAFGLAGTGVLGVLAQDSGWGLLLVLHAAPTLAVLLVPRFAREFDAGNQTV